MPKRKNDSDSEESVWEESSADEDEDDEDLDAEESSEEDEIVVQKKKAKIPKAKVSVPKVKSVAPKPKEKVNDPLSSSSEEEDIDIPTADVPSILRRTVKGGYRATHEQRRKIGLANKGNVPWNKGKNRSELAKSRIRAGVQAANRKKLKVKLKAFGLTEEEYELKMKQIKRARERLRLAKKATAEQRQRVKHATIRTTAAAAAKAKKEAEEIAAREAEERRKAAEAAEAARLAALAQAAKIQAEQNAAIVQAMQARIRNRPNATSSAEGVPGFPRQLTLETITFQPYPVFPKEDDLPGDSNGRVFATGSCPTNSGPGGLICCQECSRRYHDLLTATAKDLEDSRINNVANSMKQMMGWISATTKGLDDAMETAQGLPPPPKPRKVAKAKVMLD